MPVNVKFNYLYRDAGNYKCWGSVVFANPDKMTVQKIEKRLKTSLFQRELFIASQIAVPQVFLYAENNAKQDDHCFHEFESVELTKQKPNDLLNRTIKHLVEQIEEESNKGWLAFIPHRERN